MENSKLLQLYQRLAAKERREIGKLLPFLQVKTEVSQLFAYLQKLGAGLPPKKLAKQLVYKKIFPKKAYEDWRMRDTMHQLCQAIEEYWLLQALRNGHPAREKILLETYRNRKLDKLHAAQSKQQKARLEKTKERDLTYLQEKVNLRHAEFYHTNTNKLQAESAEILVELMADLDRYYASAKLRYAYELKAYELVMKQAHPVLLKEEIKALVKRIPIDFPLANQYLNMLDLLESKDAILYEKLKKDFLEKRVEGKREDRLSLFQMLINVAGARVNQGEKSGLADLLALYLEGLEQGLLVEFGRLGHTDFGNIVSLACAIGNLDKAKHVVDKYASLLDPKIKDSVVALFLALIRFWEQKYEETLDCLQQVQAEDFSFKIIHRKLLIQTYYELQQNGANQPLTEECSSFRKFLYNHQEQYSEIAFKGNLNFIKIVARLELFPYQKKVRKEELLAKLDEFQYISNRVWLEKKVNAL